LLSGIHRDVIASLSEAISSLSLSRKGKPCGDLLPILKNYGTSRKRKKRTRRMKFAKRGERKIIQKNSEEEEQK
jgi:hypothetical protein